VLGPPLYDPALQQRRVGRPSCCTALLCGLAEGGHSIPASAGARVECAWVAGGPVGAGWAASGEMPVWGRGWASGPSEETTQPGCSPTHGGVCLTWRLRNSGSQRADLISCWQVSRSLLLCPVVLGGKLAVAQIYTRISSSVCPRLGLGSQHYVTG